MYFDTKNYLKNNHNHTAKYTLNLMHQPRKLYIYKHLIYYFNIFLNKNILKKFNACYYKKDFLVLNKVGSFLK